MSGFSPDWLALREPVDHRSRDAGLARALAQAFEDTSRIEVVDMGCGTGSNLRGTYLHLPQHQSWTLVDYDPRLLQAARDTLVAWADTHSTNADALALTKGHHHLEVRFREADLNASLDDVIAAGTNLVTAAAFFDLASPAFIGRLAAIVTRQRAAFYTTLTYNGQQEWTPSHPADRAMATAFHAHQRGDKGLGEAAGPAAPTALATAFQAAGYQVQEADSPWLLGAADIDLIAQLATGFAAAVRETGDVGSDSIDDWSGVSRSSAVVGHTDTLALPE